jgi:proton glutamate symport protein
MISLQRIPLYLQILIAMLLGALAGYLFLLAGIPQAVTDWIKPWGTIFIRLLKLIAVPLVFISLVKGVSQMSDLTQLTRLGVKTVGTYILTTLLAVSLGMGMVSLIKPGNYLPKEKTAALNEAYQNNLSDQLQQADALKNTGPLSFIVDIIPENLAMAASDNSKMLQIIFVALVAGIALIAVGKEKAAPLQPIIDSVNTIILKIIDFIMLYAPFGVFALMAGMVTDFAGDTAIFASLGMYALTVILSLTMLAFVLYPVAVKLFAHYPAFKFLRGIFPIQLLAFSTSSSAATLPFTMEHSQKKLGVSEETASFVFPVGATINMDGTSAYQAVSILFIAQLYGIDLSGAQLISVLLLTVLASIGTPGVPGGSIVMTLMVLSSIGIPAEGLVLILGIDRPLDMLRTVVNVSGDVLVAKLMDKKPK